MDYDPSARTQTSHFLTLVADLGRGNVGRGNGPRGLEMAAACQGVGSQNLATVLDTFRAIFIDLSQTAYLRFEPCDIAPRLWVLT